jgi:hypothetical protein
MSAPSADKDATLHARRPLQTPPDRPVPLFSAHAPRATEEELPHHEYAAAINMIGHLFEHHPEAFKAMMVSLRGIYETHKEKK